MKALVIAPQPFFSPRGTPISVYYRTLITSELGWEVDLLTYGEGQDVDIPGVRIIRIPRFASLGNVKVGPSFLKLFLDIFVILWTIGLLLRERYDMVHAHEEAIFFCRFLKPIFGFKLIYDMHSSLPQQLTNFRFTTSKFLITLFARLERSCLHAADAVITICPDLAQQVNQLILDRKKHYLIENSIFEPIKVSLNGSGVGSVPCRSGFEEKPVELPERRRVVVYAGTLEPYQGIDILIPAFGNVLRHAPDAFLLIVGGTEKQVEHYRALAVRCGLGPNALFTGRVSPSLAKHYCRIASVQVSPRCNGTNTPLKVYEQLASCIPLVATDIYSHTQVLNSEVAFLVRPEAEDLARGILAALRPNTESRRITTNARQLYEEKYSRPVYVEKMRHLLELVR